MSDHNKNATDLREIKIGDMAPLILRFREFLDAHCDEAAFFECSGDSRELAARFGFTGRKGGKPEVVLAEEAAVELGHPLTTSHAILLVTPQAELVHPGRISLVGPEVKALEPDQRYPLVQVVILAVRLDKLPDPFALENTQYLMHRLPGYMVRSVPGRLWIRIGKRAFTAGLNLQVVGRALVAAYQEEFPELLGVEAALITSSRANLTPLSLLAAEATILAGRHKKLSLGIDGEVECSELNCESCEEKPTCDNLRDIVIKKRRRS